MHLYFDEIDIFLFKINNFPFNIYWL